MADPVAVAAKSTSLRAGRSKGLRANALGLGAGTVIGLASAGPAYSLSSASRDLFGLVGPHALAIVALAFVPNLCIACATRELNRVSPDCGTSYHWVARAFGPAAGWATAWTMLMTDVFVMATFAALAARITPLLPGLEGMNAGPLVAAATGLGWIAALTLISLRAIRVSVRVQWAWLAFELIATLGCAAVTLVRVFHGVAPATALRPQWSWLSTSGLTGSQIASGLLVAMFIYWGWDSSLAMNEESRARRRTPGIASIAAAASLLVFYAVVVTAITSWYGVGLAAGIAFLGDDTLLADWGRAVSPSLGPLLVVVTLSSIVASAQTTLLPAARLALSMACRTALPPAFAKVDARSASPTMATIAIAGASALLYVALVAAGRDALDDMIEATTALIALYYAATGLACAWWFRRTSWRRTTAFALRVAVPWAGAAMLIAALVAAVHEKIAKGTGLRAAGFGGALTIDLAALAIGAVVFATLHRLHRRPAARVTP